MKNRLTTEQIENGLGSITGSRIIGLTTVTEPKMRKTNNPYIGKVFKVSKYGAVVNFHYDAGVLRRLEKEGKSADDFKKGESWHEPVLTQDGKLTPFCQHKKTGEKYLRVQRLNGHSRYVDEKGRFFAKSKIEPFLQESSSYANQGLDNPLVFLTLKLSNVVSVRGI